jgi:hypothetical protein
MYNPDIFKPKAGIIDQYIEKFEKLQGSGFCFGIREIALDVRGTELINGYLVLETSSWLYETARNPQALEEIVNKLNTASKPPTLDELKSLAWKMNLHMAEPVRNRAALPTNFYISSRRAALLLALCRHLKSCKDPGHCGWETFLEGIK